MPFSGDRTIDQVRLELELHVRGAIGAHTDEAHPTAWHAFQRRDAHLFGEALCCHLALV